MNKAFVFQMITSGAVLDAAHNAGFKTVLFSSKGSSGDYVFDLSNGVPNCAQGNRVCR
jgi:hypothetical protein